MASISLRIPSVLTPHEAWQAVWNLARHSEVIPLTQLQGSALSADTLKVGDEFSARTALGPLGFDDAMRFVVFNPPGPDGHGKAIIEKTGRLMQGHIVMAAQPAPGGCVVTWEQHLQVHGVPALLDPLTSRAAAKSYEQVLRRLLAEFAVVRG